MIKDIKFAFAMFMARRMGMFKFPGLCYLTSKQKQDFIIQSNHAMHTIFEQMKEEQK